MHSLVWFQATEDSGKTNCSLVVLKKENVRFLPLLTTKFNLDQLNIKLKLQTSTFITIFKICEKNMIILYLLKKNVLKITCFQDFLIVTGESWTPRSPKCRRTN